MSATSQSTFEARTLTEIMREQRRALINWRRLRRASGTAPLDRIASFGRASTFDQNDLHSANLEFDDEIATFLAWRAKQGESFVPRPQPPGFEGDYLKEYEEIACWWDQAAPVPPAAAHFFDEHVHDSHAWFKISPVDPDSEEGTHAQLKNWVRRLRTVPRNGQDEEMLTGLTREQIRAADEYSQTGKIPRMHTQGREAQTVAKAGYLRYRRIYAGSNTKWLSRHERLEPETDNALA